MEYIRIVHRQLPSNLTEEEYLKSINELDVTKKSQLKFIYFSIGVFDLKMNRKKHSRAYFYADSQNLDEIKKQLENMKICDMKFNTNVMKALETIKDVVAKNEVCIIETGFFREFRENGVIASFQEKYQKYIKDEPETDGIPTIISYINTTIVMIFNSSRTKITDQKGVITIVI